MFLFLCQVTETELIRLKEAFFMLYTEKHPAEVNHDEEQEVPWLVKNTY